MHLTDETLIADNATTEIPDVDTVKRARSASWSACWGG